MIADTTSRKNRMLIGLLAEQRFVGLLLSNNKSFKRTAQEAWLPEWIHNKLRYINNNEGIQLIRHFPDFATEKALIQIKAAPNENNYLCVTIEKASYQTSKQLSDLGIPVLIVWQYQDHKLHAQWVNKLSITLPDTDRRETKGAHTPYVLINKKLLKPIDEFMDEI